MSGMSGPEHVRVKRKRGDQAPDALIVERPGKKNKQDTTEHAYHYVLRKDDADDKKNEPEAAQSLFDANDVERRAAESSVRPKASRNISGNGINGGQSAAKERRVFHLRRPTTPEAGVRKRGKAKVKEDGVATFVEKRKKNVAQRLEGIAGRDRSSSLSVSSPPPPAPLKRPGKGAAVKISSDAPSFFASSHAKHDSQVEAMANSLHQFAVEEAAKESTTQALPRKPKITATPKLSGQRSRALHQQRASQSSTLSRANDTDDTSMDDDADYVYDTYVLAPSSNLGAVQADTSQGNVGYLIIGEEDEAVWETYMEEDSSDEEPSDEDDENAEDWYGADYPEDELASDDEHDRNAYNYRAGDSDEEYDEHTFSDDEYEAQMNPWRKKTPQQFSRYFNGEANVEDQ
ncbi:hypothetical protein HII31_01010 [Pseudocercospora fuligena]|uniref:Transcription factor Iwr1 domain-containing protein n=1 Tax=Pseudocercospora fuligena TaxID=685502 RepID=A0A8H6RSL3_9PEZI|nr:hypothetical protein HII31_01010 [Pseudocercospora fuligena]